jgi:XTP/dITP diphosphohydrolase
VIATHNAGKWREFDALLSAYVPSIVSAGSLGLLSPDETGESCVDNAILKANAVALALQDPSGLVLADDSGFFVTALDGRPGVHAADWMKPDAAAAIKRVEHELGESADRSCFFLCVLALRWSDGHIDLIEGRIDGHVAREARGTNGHGYDPIFVPNGHSRTFAEINDEEKNAISHRGIAARAMIERFFL